MSVWDCDMELFERTFSEIKGMIKRYEKFPPETRFLMLIDKLTIILTMARTVMTLQQQMELNKIDNNTELSDEVKLEKKQQMVIRLDESTEIMDLLKKELFALEDFIQSDTKSILSKMNNKLDEVLMGPYYASGKELMKNAHVEFDDLNKHK